MKKSYLLTLVASLIALNTAMSAYAGDVVSADKIYKSLTTQPKAVIGADGKVRQADPTIDLQVPFDFNKSILKIEGKLQLDQLAQAFSQAGLSNAHFEIGGHTDKVGSYDYNIKLSTERANAVRDYLNQKHGITLDRLETHGYGFTKLADEKDPKNAANRRVEIKHLIQRPAPVQQVAPTTPPATLPPVAPTGGEIIQRPQ